MTNYLLTITSFVLENIFCLNYHVSELNARTASSTRAGHTTLVPINSSDMQISPRADSAKGRDANETNIIIPAGPLPGLSALISALRSAE